MRRRTFIASTIAATTLPQLVSAQAVAFDPTPQKVRIKKNYKVGELLILPRSYYLYFVTAPGEAMRYGVGVGKAGLEFTGSATISVKTEWPTGRPKNGVAYTHLPRPTQRQG